MLSITHCDGISVNGLMCPIREKCRRHDYFRKIENYGIKRYEMNTSFFTVAPYDYLKKDCSMFWGDFADRMFHLKKLKKKIGYKLKKSVTKKKK